MTRILSLLLCVGLVAVPVAYAGQEPRNGAPRAEAARPDLEGVWNFSSAAPLERPVAFAGKKEFTREEFDARRAAFQKGMAAIARFAPVEAIGLDWFDDRPPVDDLRTSVITYPENGRLPALMTGVRRMPNPEDFLPLLANLKDGPPPPALTSFAAMFAGGKKNSYTDFSASERCLMDAPIPMVPSQFGGGYLQIVQGTDSVVLISDFGRRVVALGGAPLGDALRSGSGTARGHWEGKTLVVETKNFSDKGQSFALAGNPRDKVVTERFTRLSKTMLQYEAIVVDPSTFKDRIELSFPMALANTHIYEAACHEGNYSLPNALSGARKEEQAVAAR